MSQIRHQQRRVAQKKHGKAGSLNLVSLMDIFTILVFFLMVNSSEVEVLQTSSKIKLPDSTSEQRPENQLVISISQEDLVLQGRPVARVAELMDPGVTVIEGLKAELEYQASRKAEMPEGGFEITIMGDRELPYWLLKKVMLTCQTTEFAQISLAVNRMQPASDPAELMQTESATAQVVTEVSQGGSS
jgi:biopolymer transport protein ExbD